MPSLQIGLAGAGLMGRLLAWRLALAGHRVIVFDPASGPEPAAGEARAAGWTAAGMLSPVAELECANAAVAALGQRSLALWPQWLAQCGQPVFFAQRGSLLLAHPSDRGVAQRLLGLLQSRSPGVAIEALDAAHRDALEPGLQRQLLAWLLPGEGQIHSVQAMQALSAAASEAGVQWRWGQTVDAIEAGRLRIEGDWQGFDCVIDARGLGARPELPLRGVRGELLWLHAPGVPLHRPLRLLHARHRVYLVPRPGDLIVVGASEIESEDRSSISLRSTVELLAAAHSVIPELAEARVVHSETNLRPALPDNLPLLHSEPGLTRINGLFRHGWLIAPALAEQALTQLEDLSR
ncbi:MAG: FAD-dependent oxidoreductase [Burkholderiaceae bacterium]|nr:FAD-dependent oxidoreductase [Burkholderiaceae bacterium]